MYDEKPDDELERTAKEVAAFSNARPKKPLRHENEEDVDNEEKVVEEVAVFVDSESLDNEPLLLFDTIGVIVFSLQFFFEC